MSGCPVDAKRWGLRKIVDGKIRLGGKVFRPDEHHREYKGELDGTWWLFGRYPGYTPKDDRESICMWGSKQFADAQTEEEITRLFEIEPNIIDGYFCWEWWREVSTYNEVRTTK